MMGMGEKPEIYKRRNIYEVEAYCFPVSVNTENKPDLS